MDVVSFATRTFDRVPWSEYVMSVTMEATRVVVSFVVGLGYLMPIIVKNALFRYKLLFGLLYISIKFDKYLGKRSRWLSKDCELGYIKDRLVL